MIKIAVLKQVTQYTWDISACSLLHYLPTRTVRTSAIQKFRYDLMYKKYKMAASAGERITVEFQQPGSVASKPAHFTQCILYAFRSESEDTTTRIHAEIRDNKLVISKPATGEDCIKIKHPEFCPIHHMTVADQSALPEAVSGRGINVGSAVLLESGDGKIFLTRRGDHLRAFPGIWVPPGGHIEQDESMIAAGLRELHEETGLHITPDMCVPDSPRLLALWESVYPPRLSLGQPKRHHAVVYVHTKLKPDITSESLWSTVSLDPGEVAAGAWFDRDQLEAIVSVVEGVGRLDSKAQALAEQHFRALVVTEETKQHESDLPFCDLLKVSGEKQDQRGRVSTGTKFALEEWFSQL